MERTDEEVLPVALTQEELRIRGDELAKAVIELDEAEDAKKLADKAMKEDIDNISARANRLSRVIQSGIEHRAVPVYESVNAHLRRVEIIRRDTGKVVRYREATVEDLTCNLFEASGDGRDDSAASAAPLQ
ncbi:MAG: hypothetical protein LBP68_06440 [Acidobacteriota bacterium]|jgi:hypothetical protein|nr:hypothetical protein [Acidobacteriota bacterium]